MGGGVGCVLEAFRGDLWPGQMQGFRQRGEKGSKEGELPLRPLLLQLPPLLHCLFSCSRMLHWLLCAESGQAELVGS